MKGTFFQKPLEYNIDIFGEKWAQGSTIDGVLNIKNHGSESIDLSNNGVHLCLVNNKKLKAKDDKAFTLVESFLSDKSTIESDSVIELKFNFTLKADCPITENTASLYLVCGDINNPFEVGALQLNITPVQTILDFIEIFENFFKFKFKAFKNKKEYIEAKITPPDSNEWSSIQSMALKTKMIDTDLELNFIFKLKKISYEDSVMATKDSKVEISKTLSKREHTNFGSV